MCVFILVQMIFLGKPRNTGRSKSLKVLVFPSSWKYLKKSIWKETATGHRCHHPTSQVHISGGTSLLLGLNNS